MMTTPEFVLPLPAASADALSMRYHVALEAMCTGNGWLGATQALTTLMFVTSFLAEAGYGRVTFAEVLGCQNALSAALRDGMAGKGWRFSAEGIEKYKTLVTLHDFQLSIAPIRAIKIAGRRLQQVNTIVTQQLSAGRRRPEFSKDKLQFGSFKWSKLSR
ncbi:hypothetical protein [Burkholderia sp. Ax-1719]|jgi:hypothetical protein|uniref:hypothetical protein n=1 Tax=Burkholderia sp. Ax-1719 TaxID=2608334 RepID=UPI00141EE463|nr:hypothetical protein [Burkholderia sp. Ax-1719]NIE65260.1 hypothetical protein [Burkholderia sp. Ax-1719]